MILIVLNNNKLHLKVKDLYCSWNFQYDLFEILKYFMGLLIFLICYEFHLDFKFWRCY